MRNLDQIKGIAVDGNEIKLVIFADNMTSFVRDKLSHRILFNTLTLFSTYFGLKVNHEKTERAHTLLAWAINQAEKTRCVTYGTDLELG